MVRVAYGDYYDIVAIVDGGCTPLFVEVRIAYCNDSEIVVKFFCICL